MLRPIMTVRTTFERFEFFNFMDHSEWNHLLRFSTRYDAQFFLRDILNDTRDPRLLGRLWREIESPVTPSHGGILNRLADNLVCGLLKVKRTPLPPFQLSPAEFDYFTAQFNKLWENDQTRAPLTRSDLPPFPEVVESPPPPQANPTSSETSVAESSSTSAATVSKSMTVAAVQMYSEDGKIQENLDTLEKLAYEAKQANSKLDLILFPELTSAGYGVGPYEEIPIPDRQKLAQDLWSAAEPSSNNQTIQKLQAVAKELQVIIGASFLETDGKDFYVTFVLFNREGQEVGRVRKQKAAAQEAYYVTSVDTPQSHVLTVEDSKFGSLKIGVGICYENYHVQLPCHFQQEGVDLVLQPHSANIMNLDGGPLAELYAKTLGVPVVMVNKYNPQVGFPGNSAMAYFTEEGELKVEPPDEATKPFIRTFSLKKQTSHPLNCDSNVIGIEPQLWPEALVQFNETPLDITRRLETFDILQKDIDKLEGQIREASNRLMELQSLIGTQPQSWSEALISFHDPFSGMSQRLETPEALQKVISELETQIGVVSMELEKLKSLRQLTIDIKKFFEGVETDGRKFYNEEYDEERENWAKKMAKPQSGPQITSTKPDDEKTESETGTKNDKSESATPQNQDNEGS